MTHHHWTWQWALSSGEILGICSSSTQVHVLFQGTVTTQATCQGRMAGVKTSVDMPLQRSLLATAL